MAARSPLAAAPLFKEATLETLQSRSALFRLRPVVRNLAA